MNSDFLPYRFNVYNPGNELQLGVGNAIIDNLDEKVLQSTAQTLFEHFDWALREQLSVFLNVDELSIVKSQMNTGLGNKSKSSKLA